jgi:copper chaperone CopZ
MTVVDVCFRYGTPPGEREMNSIERVWEVYGIRRIQFDEKESTVRVEFDATRLNEETVASLLRQAGIDVREKVALAWSQNCISFLHYHRFDKAQAFEYFPL